MPIERNMAALIVRMSSLKRNLLHLTHIHCGAKRVFVDLLILVVFTRCSLRSPNEQNEPNIEIRQMNKGLGNLYIQDLALHPENQEMIFAATKKGFYKSVNGGGEWFRSGEGITSQDITSIVVSGGDEIFVGTWGDGVFVSTDLGQSWQPSNHNLGDPRISEIALAPSDPKVIYLATSSGVYFSLNASGSWQRNPGPVYHLVKSIVVHPDQPGVVYAGTRGYGIFLSRDTTRTWLKRSSGLSYNPNEKWYGTILDLEIKENDPNFIAAASAVGFFRSTDGGENWSKHTNGIGYPSIYQTSFNLKNDSQIYIATNIGFFVSNDNGDSWQQLLGTKDIPFEIRTFEFGDERTVYLGTWGGGVYKFRIK